MIASRTVDDRDLNDLIARFYSREAALLDDERLGDWLDLLSENVRYEMPMPERRQGDIPATLNGLPGFYLYNDDKESLRDRVARIDTGLAITSVPLAGVVRFVTNVLVERCEGDSVWTRSNVLVHFVRDQRNETRYAARRRDRLTVAGNSVLLEARSIELIHAVLPRTISIFF